MKASDSSEGLKPKLDWLGISFQVILGGVFIWAGLVKLVALDEFVESISYYEIPPFSDAPLDMWLGYLLPGFEIVVGTCLIFGTIYRGALVCAGLMSLGFLAAIISVHVRGLNIECGCFGKSLSFGSYYVHEAVLGIMIFMTAVLIRKELNQKD